MSLPESQIESTSINRRSLLLRGAAAAVTGLGFYAFGVEPQWVSVEHHNLPIRNLPKHLQGKRAVQFSDTHVGHTVGENYLRRQFDYVDSLQPDFVFFTGDFLDDATEWHVEQGLKLLPYFPRGSLGTACVLGNHDFGHFHADVIHNAPNTERLVNAFKYEGLNLLRCEEIEFAGLSIAGLPDYHHGNFQNEPARDLIGSIADGRPSIVLSHNPDTADLPIWKGYRNWILCGHTHGGQVRFPVVGPPQLPVKNRNYIAGQYRIEGGHQMYINRGLGHTARVRFMARPEITVFTLSRAVA